VAAASTEFTNQITSARHSEQTDEYAEYQFTEEEVREANGDTLFDSVIKEKTEAMLKYIIKFNVPITSTTDSEARAEFRRLGLNIPSRTKIYKELEKGAQARKTRNIENSDGVHLIIDVWMTSSKSDVLGIMVATPDKQKTMRYEPLALVRLEKNQEATTIAEVLGAVIKEYGLRNISTVTMDGGANLANAVDMLPGDHVKLPCYSHIVNNALKRLFALNLLTDLNQLYIKLGKLRKRMNSTIGLSDGSLTRFSATVRQALYVHKYAEELVEFERTRQENLKRKRADGGPLLQGEDYEAFTHLANALEPVLEFVTKSQGNDFLLPDAIVGLSTRRGYRSRRLHCGQRHAPLFGRPSESLLVLGSKKRL